MADVAVDLLIHNAGINTGSLSDMMKTNEQAAFDTVEAMLPAVARSSQRWGVRATAH